MEKRRSSGKVTGDLFAGEVDGKAVFHRRRHDRFGGHDAARGALLPRTKRDRRPCDGDAWAIRQRRRKSCFGAEEIDRIIVTDSVCSAVAASSDFPSSRLKLVSVAPLMAEAIRRLHEGEAISDLTGIED